jgi:hypothetical protein
MRRLDQQQQEYNQQQQQQLYYYQYRCLSCETLLNETETPIDSKILRSLKNEKCDSCGNLLQEQTIIVEQKKKMMIDRSRPVATIISSTQTPAMVPTFETADKIRQLSKLTFGIPEIDCLLDFAAADRGAICIARSNKRNSDGGGGGGCYYHYWHTNTLVTRLCVRALMSRQYGGLESPSIIFIDAGNCSDIYQTVNFARQYGLDIEKVLNSIIVSRPFTIHHLASLIINDLEPAVQRFGAKLVVVSDLLKMFVQDPQIDTDEARWLVKEIIKALQKLSTQVFVVVSLHDNDCPSQHRNYLVSIFDSRIDITTTTVADSQQQQQKSLQLKISTRCHSGSSRQLSMPEKDLQIVSAARAGGDRCKISRG